jgi:hypothetical protein
MPKKDPHSHVRKPTKVRAFEVVTGATIPQWVIDGGLTQEDFEPMNLPDGGKHYPIARGAFIVQKEHLGTLEVMTPERFHFEYDAL